MVKIESLLILTEAIHVCVAVASFYCSILTLNFASSFLVTEVDCCLFYLFMYSGCIIQASS